jgi:hypothetical protein
VAKRDLICVVMVKDLGIWFFFLLIFGLFDEVGDNDEDEVAVFIYGI